MPVKGGGALLLTAASCDLNYAAVRRPSGPATTRLVNHLRLGEALLTMNDPPIRALYVSANNPAVTCPEVHKVQKGSGARGPVHGRARSLPDRYRALRRYRSAGGELPETDDLYRALWRLLDAWGRQAVKPQGEARSNFDVAQALPGGMGLTDKIFTPLPRQAAEELFRGRPDPPPPPTAPKCSPASRSTSPTTGTASRSPRRRASSKFYSEQLARQGCRRCPTGTRSDRAADAAAGRSARSPRPGYFPGPHRLLGVGFLRNREGEPFCVLHPEDASPATCRWRAVRLFNDRGEIGLVCASATKSNPASSWFRPAADQRIGIRHHQHAVLRPLHRHGRRRDVPEHMASMSVRTGAQQAAE